MEHVTSGKSGAVDIMLEGIMRRNVVAFVKCHTGYVGCDSSEAVLFPAHFNIDEIVRDMANENAQSHGHDGDYACASCGAGGEEHCDDCGQDCEWEENEGIEGYAVQFVLSEHSGRIGGFSWSEIINPLMEAGALVVVSGFPMEYHVKRDMLFGENGLFNDRGDPQKEWDFFVDDAGHDGYKIVEYVAAPC
ncbi:hypothetical protein CPT_Slocum_014 [Serratia phage Slocum]|nr:hypothetical protein CPT_Slocum_014 [Serratia phage Slocum]